jgi:hypothetical protein
MTHSASLGAYATNLVRLFVAVKWSTLIPTGGPTAFTAVSFAMTRMLAL